MLSLSSDRYFETLFAVWWGGGVVNPINVRWSSREIAFSLEACSTRILIVDETFAPMVRELGERARCLHTIIHAGDGAAPAGMFDYEQLIASMRRRRMRSVAATIWPACSTPVGRPARPRA